MDGNVLQCTVVLPHKTNYTGFQLDAIVYTFLQGMICDGVKSRGPIVYCGMLRKKVSQVVIPDGQSFHQKL